MKAKIIYTKTDEAPFLATYSLLPILKSFLSKVDVELELKDISLAASLQTSYIESGLCIRLFGVLLSSVDQIHHFLLQFHRLIV